MPLLAAVSLVKSFGGMVWLLVCLGLHLDGSLALYVIRCCGLACLQGLKASRTGDAQSFDRHSASTVFDYDCALPRAALPFLEM